MSTWGKTPVYLCTTFCLSQLFNPMVFTIWPQFFIIYTKACVDTESGVAWETNVSWINIFKLTFVSYYFVSIFSSWKFRNYLLWWVIWLGNLSRQRHGNLLILLSNLQYCQECLKSPGISSGNIVHSHDISVH